jgi:hypothetical protein
MVPGSALAAWSGPAGSSLVAYRALPMPGGSAGAFATALANRLENLPGFTLVVNRAETIAGATAARVEAIAPGIGARLVPSGTGIPVAPEGMTAAPTRQVTVAFVRGDLTLVFVWHVFDASYAQIAPDIETTLESLRFTSSARTSSYSG